MAMGLRVARRHSGAWAKWLAVGCGGLAVIALILVGVVYFLLTSEPPELAGSSGQRVAGGGVVGGQIPGQAPGQQGPGQTTARAESARGSGMAPTHGGRGAGEGKGAAGGATARPGAVSPNVPALNQQIEAIRAAVKQGYRGPVQVVVTEREMASQLRGALGGRASEVAVRVTENEILVSGRVSVAGIKAPVVVHLRPEVKDGAPRLVVTGASVGRMGLGEERIAELQKKLDQRIMMPAMRDKNVQVTGIWLQPGYVVVQGNVGRGR